MLTNPVNPVGGPPPRNVSSTGFVLGTELRYRHRAGNIHAPDPYGDGQFQPGSNFTNSTWDKTLQGFFLILCIGLSMYHLAFGIIYINISLNDMDKNDKKRNIVTALGFVHLIFSIVFIFSIAFFIYVLNMDSGDLTLPADGAVMIPYDGTNRLHITIKDKVKLTVNFSRLILFMNIATFVYFLVFILYFQPKLYP